MKKVLALLLAVLMLASIGCAWAEETVEEPAEITFQDIPWGLSVEEVQGALEKTGAETRYYDDHFESGILNDDENSVINYTDSLREGSMLLVTDYPELIGGYEVKMMCFDFLLGVENQSWNRNETHLRQVSIKLVNHDFDDLLQKMTNIYGEPTPMGYGYMWYGDNSTAVYLQDGSYCLYYGKIDALETIEAQWAEINGLPIPTANPSDTNGL